MTLSSMISRAPIAYDPSIGAEVSGEFGDLDSQLREVIAGTAGCSPYLRGLLQQGGDWVRHCAVMDPQEAFDGLLRDMSSLELASMPKGLRRAKRKAALLIALADVSGAWSLEQVTRALTNLADHAVDVALRALVAAEIARGKLPGLTQSDAETAGGMVALAMGKQGAYELNYSSDIDLICLFDQDRFASDDYHDARAGFIRVTRKMASMMSEVTGDGYVFRTDLRLRPDPSVTPVCIAMDGAERYYESVGRTWERAAHIKARPAAGDLKAGARYLERLTPFVWRKHLDFAAIQDAHDIRIKIRNHKGFHGEVDLFDHNIKLGRGGIREIEFFVQTQQLISGGRDPDLRVKGTVPGLFALADKNWIPQDTAENLTQHYRAHREIEHRLQMIADAQTHVMPSNADGMDRLARFSGEGDTKAFCDNLLSRLNEVHAQCEGFFAPETVPTTPTPPDWAEDVMARWPSYAAFRSDRARELFARLRPVLLERMEATGQPQEALRAFDGFLAGLPAGVQLFSLLNEKPQLVDLIVDISSVSPDLALYLSRNASVFDAVIGGDFFAPWPGVHALSAELQNVLTHGDYEQKLDAARRWNKEWHFRIGVHLLRGLIGTDEAAAQYADLAQAVLSALWPVVRAQFALKHGPCPGRGAIVLGMGSLGAGRFGPRSDLDMIVIYDADGIEASDGPRPLAARPYYAKLTQALITALTAPTAEGRLYEVDMRLRPSGNQGPVATSWDAFKSYQRDEAWTWEHLALTRARVMAGASGLAPDFDAFRQALLAEKSNPSEIVSATEDMRARLSKAKTKRSAWDAKQGPGRAQDIELIAQAAALAAASPVLRTNAQLIAGAQSGWFTKAEATSLRLTYDLFRRLEIAGKLLTDAPLTAQTLSPAGLSFLLRAVGERDQAALERQIEIRQSEAISAIEASLDRAKGQKGE